MSNIWKFSSLSEPYVEKWLQRAATIENNNKWSEKFKHVNQSFLDEYKIKKMMKENINEEVLDEGDVEMPPADNAMDISVLEEEIPTKTYDENFYKLIDSEPLLHVDYMIEKCLENPKLITELAEHLSINTIEKICDYLFNNKNNNEKFISIFMVHFFTTFLKRDQYRLALELILKANNAYPDHFNLLLIELLKNVQLKNSILQEIMQKSNSKLQKQFTSALMQTNISTDIFLHHLYTIHIVYKDCQKTENLQVFMQSLLIENSEFCINNMNFGRLLLTFLQTQKSLGLTNCAILDKIVEQHKTPYKRLCLSVLNGIQ